MYPFWLLFLPNTQKMLKGPSFFVKGNYSLSSSSPLLPSPSPSSSEAEIQWTQLHCSWLLWKNMIPPHGQLNHIIPKFSKGSKGIPQHLKALYQQTASHSNFQIIEYENTSLHIYALGILWKLGFSKGIIISLSLSLFVCMLQSEPEDYQYGEIIFETATSP